MNEPTDEELLDIIHRIADATEGDKPTLAEFREMLDPGELRALRLTVMEARRGYVKATVLQ